MVEERDAKVYPRRMYLICSCGSEMEHTKQVRVTTSVSQDTTTHVKEYEHRCPLCKRRVMKKRVFPYIFYEEMED